MIESTQVVRYGRQASEALAAAIGDAQRDDPLAPVTVVVPSNFVGLSIRRMFGSGLLTGQRGAGLASVAFVTPFQLVELVAADLLLDSRPITNPVLGAAVRHVLRTDPGPYARVAEHQATEAALAALFAELSNVDEAGLESMLDEGSNAATFAIGFHRAIADRLDGFHTEAQLVSEAADRPDLAARLAPLGEVIWFLPAPATPPLTRFVHRVLTDARSRVIIGVSGAEDADEPVWRTAEAAGVVRPARVPITEPPVADRIVSVTDATEEVREVCARVLGLLADGVAPERIGVFVPTPDPYVRIIEQQFDAAGVPVNGPDPRRLLDSVAGRTLVGALELPDGRWRRDRVLAVVSGGPVRVRGRRAHPTAWDALSREAGVVGDLSDWVAKLEGHRAKLEETKRIAGEAGAAAREQAVTDDLADLEQLAGFVEDTVSGVSSVAAESSWGGKCAAARSLLVELLGPEHQHATWPDAEQDAFARVDEALGRLAALDDIEPAPRPEVFLRALRTELDVARGRNGRFGEGVLYGSLVSSVGHDLDAVFVLGAAEGSLPVPRRDDAILPESVRMASLDQIEPKRQRLHHQHRAFLAALDAAPPGRRTLTFPRGSLRSSRRAQPSRWLLDTASALAGARVLATDFDQLGPSVVDTIGSFASGLASTDTHTSIGDRDAAAIDLRSVAHDHPLATLTGRGIEMQHARANHEFTEFDGNLAGVSTGLGERPLSPSRLETWATCGFRYLMRYVLDASGRDDPARIEELSALDRGSLLHETLEAFIRRALDEGVPEPTTKWPDEARRLLHQIGDEVADTYERAGRTGRPVHWRVQRDDLHDLLDVFISVDDGFRAAHGVTPHAVELDFGTSTGAAVDIELAGGRAVRLRGLADRVDVSPDGQRVVVSDYKSGRADKFKKLDDDPFNAGTTLQLGLYAEGALRETGAVSVRSDYWMLESDTTRRGYEWTDALRLRFREVLSAIVDGIDGGAFVAAPGDWNSFRMTNENCAYCDFDSLCQRSRGDQAAAKAADPALEVRARLIPVTAVPNMEVGDS